MICICVRVCVSANRGSCRGGGWGVPEIGNCPSPFPHVGNPHGQWQTRGGGREESQGEKMERCQHVFPLAPGWSSRPACSTLFVRIHLNTISWKQIVDYHSFRGECAYSLYCPLEKQLYLFLSLFKHRHTVPYILPCLHMCLDWKFPCNPSPPRPLFSPWGWAD